jgi:hypothetical protein
MERKEIIDIALNKEVINENHYGSDWVKKLESFVLHILDREHQRCEIEKQDLRKEIEILKNELEDLNKSCLILDKEIFDGHQK